MILSRILITLINILNIKIFLFSALKFFVQNDEKSEELNLALRRLIRGTGSANITSRKSFYVTLTAYLTTNPDTPVEKILEILENVLQPVNNKHKSVSF